METKNSSKGTVLKAPFTIHKSLPYTALEVHKSIIDTARCPYCKHADNAIAKLLQENPAYGSIEIEKINEAITPLKAKNYDYYYVPSMFIGDSKIYEANPSQDYDDIKASVRRVFDLAIQE